MAERAERVELHAPDEVVRVASKLEEAGYPTWVVGGAVRDALRGEIPGDWDLTTAARPSDVQRTFRRTVPVGIAHGTVGVLTGSGKMYEVTTFRLDVETFGRHARVSFADTLEEDLSRRDFTINAIAWHPLTRELRDPHQGALDIERKTLRTVGAPDRRFEEDRLRVLRALRFAGGLGMEIEPTTWEAILASSDRLGNLSAERIREELWKILSGHETPSRALSLYAESGVLAALYPELDHCRVARPNQEPDRSLWEYTLRAVDWVTKTRPTIRLAAFLHATGRDDASGPRLSSSEAARSAAIARDVTRRLKASNAESDTVTHLIAQLAPLPRADGPTPEIRRWIRRVGPEYLNDLVRLLTAVTHAWESTPGPLTDEVARLRVRAEAVRRSGIPFEVRELEVDGSDLRKLGVPAGPGLGDILRELLELVTDDRLTNRRTELLEYVRRSYPRIADA